MIKEADRLRRALFPGPILGLGPADEWAIVGRAMAARSRLRGHSVATVRALAEGLAWAELGPTPLARELIEGLMRRVRLYLIGSLDWLVKGEGD